MDVYATLYKFHVSTGMTISLSLSACAYARACACVRACVRVCVCWVRLGEEGDRALMNFTWPLFLT